MNSKKNLKSSSIRFAVGTFLTFVVSLAATSYLLGKIHAKKVLKLQEEIRKTLNTNSSILTKEEESERNSLWERTTKAAIDMNIVELETIQNEAHVFVEQVHTRQAYAKLKEQLNGIIMAESQGVNNEIKDKFTLLKAEIDELIINRTNKERIETKLNQLVDIQKEHEIWIQEQARNSKILSY